ncbi:MAG TPA: NUDIX hydrolase [Candidatus Kapabacteria bacterium]|nr:NUDIX hydrolase [Candidatus Kapabacteria bacterium]
MPDRLKKISEEVIHDNRWWRYKRDIFENKAGKQGEYYYGETNGMVMVIPILPNGNVLLTLQHRYLVDKQSIEFPGGGIQAGEHLEEAVKREVLEETGWTIDHCINIGTFEPANGFVKDSSHIFLAYLDEQVGAQPDENEDIALLERRIDEIEEMVRKNEIWDGQTLASWALVRHHLLKHNM